MRNCCGARRSAPVRAWLVGRLHVFDAAGAPVAHPFSPFDGAPVPAPSAFGAFAEGVLLWLPMAGFPVLLGDLRRRTRSESRPTIAGWALFEHGVRQNTPPVRRHGKLTPQRQ